ncbi:sirohydrochlorin chelatase [Oryzobacter telluris]|uniref:sirohydrochlorin chelatase n=1 Tax=Oryzobacter telluris TaxID=3149179 RepID=UPI00370D7660
MSPHSQPPALVVCAHGTRDPAGRAAVRAVVDEVAALLPEVAVHEAFVDVHSPFVADVVAGLPSGEPLSGVVVPLLLAGGFHVHVDIAQAVAARTDVVATPALGPDDRLVDVVLDRLLVSGAPAGGVVVLAPAGSSDERAQADSAEVAGRVARRWGAPVLLAYAAGPQPAVADAVREAQEAGGGAPVTVASYLLAPGFFQGRLETSGADVVTGPVLPDPRVAEIVIDRYRAAVSAAG